jgi:predicted nuclease of predicted toxin-antitoxin system
VKKPKLLLDSCLPRAVAQRLRVDGWDVATVAEGGADPGDASVLGRAVSEGRVLVTIDADFGALVFRDGAKHVGVLRLREGRPVTLADRASTLVKAYADELARGAFVTDDGDRVRVTLP